MKFGINYRFGPLILHFGVVKREEQYLELKFGESYRSYKRAVPRYWMY